MSIDISEATRQSAGDRRSDVALRIADEVRRAHHSGLTKLTKVTSLLHAFRATGSPAGMKEVLSDLEVAGLRLDSGWRDQTTGLPDIHRTGVLEISPREPTQVRSAATETDDTIRLSIWSPGSAGLEESLPLHSGRPATGEVLWFDIEPPTTAAAALGSSAGSPSSAALESDPKGAEASVRQLLETQERAFEARICHVRASLGPWCPGLTDEMLRDLLRQDLQPKVESYGDEAQGARGVSAVSVIARERPGSSADADGVTEELVFQLVEMIVGDGWIATCWHPSRLYCGANEMGSENSILREPFLSHVRHQWLTTSSATPPRPKTAGDLGVYLAISLLGTYTASHRMMERWVESWEVDFFSSLSTSDKGKQLKHSALEISNALSMVGEVRRRLTAFEHARWSTTDRSWFPRLSDRDESEREPALQSPSVLTLARTLTTAKEKFAHLSSDIRADMDLLMLHSQATQQESAERLQGYLGKVTGLVLVPTLVAGLFGANTQLPGLGSWMGFEIMLLLMVLSAIAVYLAIHKLSESGPAADTLTRISRTEVRWPTGLLKRGTHQRSRSS
jgi:CorA-like Mg2+ transporter protein